MSNFNRFFLGFAIMAFTYLACNKSNQPTNPAETVKVTLEILAIQDVPYEIDSTLCYVHNFENWPNMCDTTRADSIANYLAHSTYPITDMWFPQLLNECYSSVHTINWVCLREAVADTSIRSMGFVRTNHVSSPCFPCYRHYKFTTIKVGA